MDITMTVVSLADKEGNERDIYIRGDLQKKYRAGNRLMSFCNSKGLVITGILCYVEPTFAASLYQHQGY